jgi:hypothetical protein
MINKTTTVDKSGGGGGGGGGGSGRPSMGSNPMAAAIGSVKLKSAGSGATGAASSPSPARAPSASGMPSNPLVAKKQPPPQKDVASPTVKRVVPPPIKEQAAPSPVVKRAPPPQPAVVASPAVPRREEPPPPPPRDTTPQHPPARAGAEQPSPASGGERWNFNESLPSVPAFQGGPRKYQSGKQAGARLMGLARLQQQQPESVPARPPPVATQPARVVKHLVFYFWPRFNIEQKGASWSAYCCEEAGASSSSYRQQQQQQQSHRRSRHSCSRSSAPSSGRRRPVTARPRSERGQGQRRAQATQDRRGVAARRHHQGCVCVFEKICLLCVDGLW